MSASGEELISREHVEACHLNGDSLLLLEHFSPCHLFLCKSLILRVEFVQIKAFLVNALLPLEEKGAVFGRPERSSQEALLKCELVDCQDGDRCIFRSHIGHISPKRRSNSSLGIVNMRSIDHNLFQLSILAEVLLRAESLSVRTSLPLYSQYLEQPRSHRQAASGGLACEHISSDCPSSHVCFRFLMVFSQWVVRLETSLKTASLIFLSQ